MEKKVRQGLWVLVIMSLGSSLQARIVVDMAPPVQLQANGSAAASSVAATTGTAPVIVESIDNPDSYFATFNPAVFATLADVSSLKRSANNMQDGVDKKFKTVAKVQPQAEQMKGYLDACDTEDNLKQKEAVKEAAYQQKREMYLRKHPEKNSQFRQAEAAAMNDASQEPAFRALLKSADLQSAWQEMKEAQSKRSVATSIVFRRWKELEKPAQNLILAYRRKKAQISSAQADRMKQLSAAVAH